MLVLPGELIEVSLPIHGVEVCAFAKLGNAQGRKDFTLELMAAQFVSDDLGMPIEA